MRIPNATLGAATGVALCVGTFLGADEGHDFGELPLTETEWVLAAESGQMALDVDWQEKLGERTLNDVAQ